MRIIHNLDEMMETARGWLAGGSVGFVPTMGNLHDEHIALMRAASQECVISVTSIFVNPIQFEQDEDLTHYLQDLKQDLQLLGDASVDVAFIPRVEDIFPLDFSTYVMLSGSIVEQVGSASSPRYIHGVATVMTKLLQLVRPDVIYFAQNDARQVAIVRKLVRDLNIDVSLRILSVVPETEVDS